MTRGLGPSLKPALVSSTHWLEHGNKLTAIFVNTNSSSRTTAQHSCNVGK